MLINLGCRLNLLPGALLVLTMIVVYVQQHVLVLHWFNRSELMLCVVVAIRRFFFITETFPSSITYQSIACTVVIVYDNNTYGI